MWFGLGGFLVAVGVTLRWLVNIPVAVIGRPTLGIALMIAGVGALGVGAWERWRQLRKDEVTPALDTDQTRPL